VRTVSIFHTTDLHGHIRPARTRDGVVNVGGLARCAAQIRAWRKESPHSLLVDAGDVYQGTPVGWMTRGRIMIDLFNQLGYDAWVIGNHEFDWGPEVVLDAVSRSKMPVLAGNMKLDGQPAGSLEDPLHPLADIVPHMVKEVGGFRIGVIGLTTPGMPYWLRPEMLNGFEAVDPVEPFQASLKYLREEAKVDAVVACGHMGLREEDDFANRVRELLDVGDGPDVYIGGHTHRDEPGRLVNGTLYTQADYYGIHCGRIDLSFDAESRRLIEKHASSVLMDERVREDPVVIEAAGKELEESDSYLEKEIGELGVRLSDEAPEAGAGSPVQGLLGAAFLHAAAKHDLAPDGVFHGTFGGGSLAAGKKTIRDAWKLLPRENRLVALHLTEEELTGVLNEAFADGSDRALHGFKVEVGRSEGGRGGRPASYFVRSIDSLAKPGARPPGHRYCIIVNSCDAQSAGKRLMRLRALSERPECKATLLPPDSRAALIEFFADRGTVGAEDLRPG